ncbi:MFS transporter [Citricoccus sp. GCM10030269]|uniref:MFS transporter n=1 Tax=Citricoccus sp. GCM10030269 TaxID=3273388 RepID=UPI00361C294B
MTEETSTSRPGAPRAGTALLTVLLIAMGVGPLLNYGLSATSDLLIRQLGVSAGQFGLLITVLFVSAAVSSMVIGRLADVLSIRSQLVFNYGGTVLALLISAIGPYYWVLVVACILVGPAQVIANPTTNRVIYSAVPATKRSGWIGVKQSGVQASQLAAGLLFPTAALWAGWSGAAIAAGVVVLLLLWWSLRHIPPEAPTDWSAVRRVLATRFRTRRTGASTSLPMQVWLFAAVAFCSGMGTQATNVYLPLFAVRDHDYSLLVGGLAAGLSGVVGVASRVFWGRALGAGRRPGTLLALIASGALMGMACMVASSALDIAGLFWAGVALHGLTVLGTNVVVNAGTMQAVDATRIGAASGTTTMGMYAGFALGPVGMGAVVELTGGFLLGWILVGAVYVLLLSLAVTMVRTERRRSRDAE